MQGLKAEILRGFWYMALPGAELKPGGMVNLRMLGEPVLVGRGKDGKVFALHDICPHRGVPLHYGTFDGETITCSYHAWRYDRGGECVEVPSMVEGQRIDMSKIRCGTYPCIEQQGIVWVYFARDREEPSGITEKPPLVPLFAEDRAPDTHVRLTFPCSIDHTTYGLMDPAHVAYVHTSRWFRAKVRTVKEKTKAFEPCDLGFKMATHQVPESQTFYKLLGKKVIADISYSLPAIRIEELHGDKHNVVGLTALTPITDEETAFHQMFWTTIGWVRPLEAGDPGAVAEIPQPGPRHRPPAARGAARRAQADADQRRQYPGALVDASQGRMGQFRQGRPRLRQSGEAEDASLHELTGIR